MTVIACRIEAFMLLAPSSHVLDDQWHSIPSVRQAKQCEGGGASPIDYLAAWRIRLAAARLRRGDEPLPRIAYSLGYASDSAFAAAFRRVLGQSPARYRILHRRVRADGGKDINALMGCEPMPPKEPSGWRY